MVTSRLPHWLALVIPLAAITFGWFATASCCEVAEAEDPGKIRWVRTADGWERIGANTETEADQEPPIHPGTLAAAMFILSAGCLAVGQSKRTTATRASTASIQIEGDDRL